MILVPFGTAFIAKLRTTDTFDLGTPDIFFNWVFTRRASFRILLNPFIVAFIIVQQFCPFVNILASGREMRLLPTEETVKLATLAFNHDITITLSPLAEHIAFLFVGRTVGNGFVGGRIVDAYDFPVQFGQFGQHFLHKAMQNNSTHFTLVHAGEKYFIVGKFLVDVVLPALPAVLMLTQHIRHELCLDIAYIALAHDEFCGLLMVLQFQVNLGEGRVVGLVILVHLLLAPLVFVQQEQHYVVLQGQHLSDILHNTLQTAEQFLCLDENKIRHRLLGHATGVEGELRGRAGIRDARVAVGEDGGLGVLGGLAVEHGHAELVVVPALLLVLQLVVLEFPECDFLVAFTIHAKYKCLLLYKYICCYNIRHTTHLLLFVDFSFQLFFGPHPYIDLLMQSERHKLRHKLRREQLDRILERERQQLQQKYQVEQEEEFNAILPGLSGINYPNHKHILSVLAANPGYSYRMLPVAGIVYQHLLSDPGHIDMDSLRILRHLTKYEEVQVPQTEQFANLLMGLAEGRDLFDSLLISSNLLDHPKYHVLRDCLIKLDFPPRIEKRVQKGALDEDPEKGDVILLMITQILCCMIVSQPLLDLKKIEEIAQTVKMTTKLQEQKWQIMASLGRIRSRFKPNTKYATILLQSFQHIIASQRFDSEVHILNFLIYAAYSEVLTSNQKIICIMTDIINGKNLVNCGYGMALDLALDCSSFYIQEGIFTIEGGPLWQILAKSQENWSREESALALLDLLQDEELIGSLIECERRQSAMEDLIKCLEKSQTEMIAASIITKVVQDRKLKSQFESLGIIKVAQRLYEEREMEDCEHLQSLLDMLADNQDM